MSIFGGLENTSVTVLLGLLIAVQCSPSYQLREVATPRTPSYSDVSQVDNAGVIFQNEIKKPVRFSCPENQAITRFYAEYWYREKDRIFSFSCSKLPSSTQNIGCIRNIVTEYVTPILFTCPPNHFLTGVYSHHGPVHGHPAADRRWRFTCCEFDNITTQSCEITGFINEYKGIIDYQAKASTCSTTQVFYTGLYGIYDQEQADRRWRVNQCEAVLSQQNEAL